MAAVRSDPPHGVAGWIVIEDSVFHLFHHPVKGYCEITNKLVQGGVFENEGERSTMPMCPGHRH